MGRVWGAMASARLILLLLMATACWKVGAAPWRAPGAGGGTEVSGMVGKKSGCVPTARGQAALGLSLHGGHAGQGTVASTQFPTQGPPSLPAQGKSQARFPPMLWFPLCPSQICSSGQMLLHVDHGGVAHV